MKSACLSKGLGYFLVGVIAVGVLALGRSWRLEGSAALGAGSVQKNKPVAAPTREFSNASVSANGGRPENGAETVTFGNLPNLAKGDIPIMPTIVVDYRDDDATRMREAGLLIGPLPLPAEGGVASGGCSFAVECDDGNPCTVDTCNFPPGMPPLSGKCVHTPAPNGQDGSVGDSHCEENFGSLCGGCNDGVFCNGVETCQGGVCTSGMAPCGGIQVCSETLDYCQAAVCSTQKKCIGGTNAGGNCTTNAQCPVAPPFPSTNARCAFTDCDDLLHCNGDETCVGGVCVASQNPCGSGALCGEKKCFIVTGPPTNFPPFCTADSDCIVEGSTATCTTEGPVCLEGRCCTSNASEPQCTRRVKCDDLGGSPCIGTSCDNAGGLFYGGDSGRLLRGDTATSCTGIMVNGVEVICPKYSSGLAPFGAITNKLGPVSDSPAAYAPFGVPLHKLGDDYKLSNDPGAGSDGYIQLNYLRLVGGSVVPGYISLEIYDKSQNFVEDVSFECTTAFGIHPVQFAPPLTIPSEGYIVMRNASAYSPNARHVWAVTDVVDVGSNDNTKLWINNGPMTVLSSLGILAFELEGEKTSPPGGACCNTAIAACENAVLPWVCKAQGNNYLGDGTLCAVCDSGPDSGAYCRRCSNNPSMTCNKDADCVGGTCIPTNSACGSPGVCVAEPACWTGACCGFSGNCAVMPEAACAGGGGVFQGFGTDCDADNGHDLGEQHCCPQPAYTGADNCEDVILHVITVPPQGEVKVITITGDNSVASSTIGSPDSCFPPSTDPNADPGWWQGFQLLDYCSLIRIDHCCTDPVHRPAYRVIYNSCPCGAAIATKPNPYKPLEPDAAPGAPYCWDDDNLWETYGLLPAGTYYYPVYSALAGHHGVYQMHITVEACPTAACCTGSTCTDNINQLECDALGGFFLAQPQRYPLVGACTAGMCDTGSCCTGPGACFDELLGLPVGQTDCTTGAGGNFVGGVTCRGGHCAQNPITSCANDDDCLGMGPCVGDPLTLAQPWPCPICELQSPSSCQSFDDSTNFASSDLHNDIVAADDFTPLGTTLNQVCVWGFYLGGDPNAVDRDCGPSVVADHFRVRVYTNSFINGRMPANLVGESTATSVRGTVPTSRIETHAGSKMYGFQMTLNTPIVGLTVGNTYWLEVANDASVSGPPQCLWFWSQRTQTSSSYSFRGTGAGYSAGFESPFDMAICTDLGLMPSTLGSQLGACCFCNGTCQQMTLANCDNSGGSWHIGDPTCASVVCPVSPPANDNCAGRVFVATDFKTTWTNSCTTTDGPEIPSSCNGDSYSLQNDVWFVWMADFNGPAVFETCTDAGEINTVMAIYSNGTGSCTCPASLGTEISCNDDGCGSIAGGSHVTLNATSGVCYTIRIGTMDHTGQGTLYVGHPAVPPICGDNLVNQPSEECDGTDDAACPGQCLPNCKCPTVCQCNADIVPPNGGDGSVGFGDISRSVECWKGINVTPDCDINCDGQITTLDIGIALCAFKTTLPGNPSNPLCCSAPHGSCCTAGLPYCWDLPNLGGNPQVNSSCSSFSGTYEGDGTLCVLGPCDCNSNGIEDTCDVECGARGSVCDVPGCGRSADCNANRVPDECETPAPTTLGACCFTYQGVASCASGETEAECQAVSGTWYSCKKCAQQNASLVTERKESIFIHIFGPPVSCDVLPGMLQRRALATCLPGQPMIDPWATSADDLRCYTFGTTGSPAIPPDFFGPGSDPFTESVCLKGQTLNNPDFPLADTLISRLADPFDVCAAPSAAPVTVEIEVAALSLVSVSPITVTYGGLNPQQWNVVVDLSTVPAPPGSLTVTKSHCNGGTYTSVLPVLPRFTFTRVGGPQIAVLDTGVAGHDPVVLTQTDPLPWVGEVDPMLPAVSDPCSAFHAGIEDVVKNPTCDCNGNKLRDSCDIVRQISADCNLNRAPDECDMAAGTSLDADQNGIPDECTNIVRGRFVSLTVAPPAGQTAIRVKLLSLHHVVPPYTGCGGTSPCPGPFTLFEGQSLYAGPPTQYAESASSSEMFQASQLQCVPYYRDWSTVGLLHLSGEAVVPSSTYQVDYLAASCAGNEETCTAISATFQMKTARWGDVETPWNPPVADPQPDTTDISALKDKFVSALKAPIKARALLFGDSRGRIDIARDLNFSDISLCVDAFKGLPYPYKPGKCTGNETKACATDADCTDPPNPTTGPCVLCP